MTGALGPELGTSARHQIVAALGRPDPSVVGRMLAAAPGLRPLVDLPYAQVWAGPGLTPWRAAERRGWTWASPAPEVRPTRWESAARDATAPGVATGPDGVVVHADALALQDLYVRRVGSAAYLSTRLAPLLDAVDGTLTPHFPGWATMLTVGAPVGSATPVEEVHRLTAGAAWSATPDGRVSQHHARPLWDDLPDPAPKPGMMTELVTEAIPAGSEPLVVTLSGGWDSRVLARLALRRGHPVQAWTTYQYHPKERDAVWAQRVAASMGLPQRMVLPRGRDWAAHQAAARRRVEFQTWMHTWLFPLSEQLRAQQLPVLDGGFGDGLLRADIANRVSRTGGDWVAAFVHATGGRRVPFTSPTLAPALADATLTELGGVAGDLAGHPNRITLLQLLARGARAVSAAPRLLVGPDIDVRMPFTHPEVVRGALAVPLADKADHAYYREVLLTACGPEGELRSSNDRGAAGQKASDSFLPPSLVSALMRTVESSERALALLGPWLRQCLDDPDGPQALRRRLRPVDVLAWAATLADFEAEYADRLDWSGWPA